ncbi:MAG: type II secretion system F family protein [Patescibacteria group bacterium]
MTNFEYTARNQEGKIIKGSLSAVNEDDLAQQLKTQNLTLTSHAARKKKSSLDISSLLQRFQSIPVTQKIFFVKNLEVMMRTGFSIGRALGVLAEQTSSKKLKNIILDLKKEVESGVTLSRALEKHKKYFSELFVNMIAAGEASGKLDEVLKSLATQMRKDHALIAKIKGAMTYPVIIVIAMVGIGIAMMVYVIPQLSSVFKEAGAELPLITRLLMSLSDLIIKQGLWVFLGLVLLIFGLRRLLKTNKGKFTYHKLVLKLPIFGPIIKKVNLARFSRSLNSLLATDIPIVKAFEIIGKTLGNVHYQNAMKEAAEKLKTGATVQKCLEVYPNLFTPVILQMIAVGEESGTLDTISEELASFYEEEVDQTMSNLSTIIEPIIMLVLGAAVALLVAAIILPIYSLSEAI